MVKPTGNCVRCYMPMRATTVERFTVGDTTYELRLCEQHADLFRSDLKKWINIGDLVDETDDNRFFKAPPRRTAGVTRGYVHVPVAQVVIDHDAPAEPEPTPPPVLSYDMSLPPGADQWVFRQHATERAEEREVSREEALWAACKPDRTWKSPDDPTLHVHKRGAIHVVVDRKANAIITVARNQRDLTEKKLEHV